MESPRSKQRIADRHAKTKQLAAAVQDFHAQHGVVFPGGVGSLQAQYMFVFSSRPSEDIFRKLEQKAPMGSLYVTWLDQTPAPRETWLPILRTHYSIIQPQEVRLFGFKKGTEIRQRLLNILQKNH